MKTDVPTPIESFAQPNNKESLAKRNTPEHPPLVLEVIETGDLLRTTPTNILCPGCSDVVATYPDGLPEYLSYFSADCEACEVTLKRWGGVAVDAAYTEVFDPEVLPEVVQSYWDNNLWSGIQTSDEYPRTKEFTEAYQRLADQFGWSWEVSCPLCRRSLSEIPQDRLDYHHWCRGSDDQGVCLCRACHDIISNGSYDNEVDWRARELGLRGKDDLQIARIALRECDHASYHDLSQLADALVARYNLPHDTSTVRCILRQVLANETLREAIDDSGPSTGGERNG